MSAKARLKIIDKELNVDGNPKAYLIHIENIKTDDSANILEFYATTRIDNKEVTLTDREYFEYVDKLESESKNKGDRVMKVCFGKFDEEVLRKKVYA